MRHLLRRVFLTLSWPYLRLRYELFARAGKRIVRVSFPERIGHLSQELDALLRDTTRAGGDTKLFYLQDLGLHFANRHLVTYIKQFVSIVPQHPAFAYVRYFDDHRNVILETHRYEVAMYQTAAVYEAFAKWGDRPPLFTLREEDRRAVGDFMREVGMPPDAWFVCLHAREGGYSTIDEQIHRFRSVDVDTFSLATTEVVRRGGWVIRMGDASMRPFQPHTNVVDYARSPLKNQQLDVALSATCRFFIGTASGLFNVAEMFGRPCVVTNMAPVSAGLAPAPQDLSICQRVRDRNGNFLSLVATLNDECGNYRLAEEFLLKGLQSVANTPTEIRDVVVEMLDRLSGALVYDAADEAQQKLFKSWLRPGHYAFGAVSRIGRNFLREHMPAS